MIEINNAVLANISLHYLGNKTSDQQIIISKQPLIIEQDLEPRLRTFFLGKFPTVYDKYRFTHPSSLKFNEVYNYIKECFSGETAFHTASQRIAQHLYEQSVHPKIKPGELYVCYFKKCTLNGSWKDAIGLFKTEVKTGYFEIDQFNEEFLIEYKEGIDTTKFDKGCLIFNTDTQDGFEVYIIDNQNRGEEAQYWKESFLGLGVISNEFHQTNQFLSIAKNFVTQQLTEEFDVTRADQIDLLNKSVEYFKSHETFEKDSFAQEVFQNDSMIQAFKNYDESYKQIHEIESPDSFDISPQAVKKQARVFKSVLKLDKNFHIYIHGDRDKIEMGVEPDGRKFYKIYFENES